MSYNASIRGVGSEPGRLNLAAEGIERTENDRSSRPNGRGAAAQEAGTGRRENLEQKRLTFWPPITFERPWVQLFALAVRLFPPLSGGSDERLRGGRGNFELVELGAAAAA